MPKRSQARAHGILAILAMVGVFNAAGLVQAAGGQRGGPPPGTAPAVDIRTGTGFILGRTLDMATGRPIAGALVVLIGYGDRVGGASGGRSAGLPALPVPSTQLAASPPRTVVTNGDGYFLFRDLAGGRFSIAATALGYLNGGYLQSKPNGSVQFLDLGDNERRGDVQIKLWKYGAISGTVLDEAGEPAVGATVRLMPRTAGPGRLLSPGRTELTDDRGSYRFGALVPGDYVVGIITTQSTMPASLFDAYRDLQISDPDRFRTLETELRNNRVGAPSPGVRIGDQVLALTGSPRVGYTPPPPGDDGRMTSYVTTFFRNAPTVVGAATVALGSGEERAGVDLSITLVPAVRITGTLTGPDGPVKNMGLSLEPAGSDLFFDAASNQAATTATDQNGAFTFLGVPAGTYTLKSTRAAVIRAGPTPVSLLFAAQPVTVDRADLTGLNVVLRPGLVMSGHVEFASAKSALTGQEFRRSNLMLAQATSATFPRSSMATVGADGTFATPGDLPGRYFVTAFAPAGWMLRSAMYNGRNIADESVELTTSDLTGVVVTFTDTPARLAGTIVDARGAPDPTAAVIIFPAEADVLRRGDFIQRRTKLSPPTTAGTFSFPDLPAGQYYVVAVDESVSDQWTDAAFRERLTAGANKVTIAEGEEKTVALKTLVVR